MSAVVYTTSISGSSIERVIHLLRVVFIRVTSDFCGSFTYDYTRLSPTVAAFVIRHLWQSDRHPTAGASDVNYIRQDSHSTAAAILLTVSTSGVRSSGLVKDTGSFKYPHNGPNEQREAEGIVSQNLFILLLDFYWSIVNKCICRGRSSSDFARNSTHALLY